MSTPATNSASSAAIQPASTTQRPAGRRVGIVCRPGHGGRDRVMALVQKLELEAIALPDPNAGDFIKRLEALRDVVDYVVILVSADVREPALLLEMGFLIAAMGPGRICFMVSGKPNMPMQLDGIARHSFDDANLWHLLLARQMRQAGLEVDLNRAA